MITEQDHHALGCMGAHHALLARRIKAGDIQMDDRRLDWSLALHEVADPTVGEPYVQLERRFLAAPNEPVVIYVFCPMAQQEWKWSRCALVDYTDLNELVWLGRVARDVPEPPLLWKGGEVHLPVEVYTRLEFHSARDDYTQFTPVIREPEGKQLALSQLCAGQELTLKHFVPNKGVTHSIIRVGYAAVEGYFANSLSLEQHSYQQALIALGLSPDENGQRTLGM